MNEENVKGKGNLMGAGNQGGRQTHKFLNRETITLRKEGHTQIIEALDRFGNLTLAQLQETSNLAQNLTVKEAMILKVWQKILEKGDHRLIKTVLSIYGIATDIKSIHYAEVDDAYKTQNVKDVQDVTPVRMNSKERIEMLQKMIEIEKNRGKS